jgi:hypothetical protein
VHLSLTISLIASAVFSGSGSDEVLFRWYGQVRAAITFGSFKSAGRRAVATLVQSPTAGGRGLHFKMNGGYLQPCVTAGGTRFCKKQGPDAQALGIVKSWHTVTLRGLILGEVLVASGAARWQAVAAFSHLACLPTFQKILSQQLVDLAELAMAAHRGGSLRLPDWVTNHPPSTLQRIQTLRALREKLRSKHFSRKRVAQPSTQLRRAQSHANSTVWQVVGEFLRGPPFVHASVSPMLLYCVGHIEAWGCWLPGPSLSRAF